MLSQKMLELRVSEMPFPGVWGIDLENSQDYKILRIAQRTVSLTFP